MPFAVIFIAAIFIVTGYRGTVSSFFGNLGGTVQQLVVPIVAIVIIGAIGYIPQMKKLSDLFLVLVLLAMFLTNGKNGFFSRFNQQIRNIKTAQPPAQGNVDLGPATWRAAGSPVGNAFGAALDPNLTGLELQPMPLLTGMLAG